MSYDNNCEGCIYHNQSHLLNTNYVTTRTSPPIGLEDNGSPVLLVFQAPGNKEWKVGKAIQPTVRRGGTAGKRIELSWGRRSKNRTDFDIINAVQCFPGNEGDRDLAPDAISIGFCSIRLKNVLNLKAYSKIIVFGEIANSQVNQVLPSLNYSPIIINAPHPNGGVSNTVLDGLW